MTEARRPEDTKVPAALKKPTGKSSRAGSSPGRMVAIIGAILFGGSAACGSLIVVIAAKSDPDLGFFLVGLYPLFLAGLVMLIIGSVLSINSRRRSRRSSVQPGTSLEPQAAPTSTSSATSEPNLFFASPATPAERRPGRGMVKAGAALLLSGCVGSIVVGSGTQLLALNPIISVVLYFILPPAWITGLVLVFVGFTRRRDQTRSPQPPRS
jgi:hypothetical protein